VNEPGEPMQIAQADLRRIIEHLQILAADPDLQNAWLHPCGWTRGEPHVHVEPDPPCMPIGELWDSLDDMWPAWRKVLGPVLTPGLETALNRLSAGFEGLGNAAFVDELQTLDLLEWAEIRRLAKEALQVAERLVQAV
jgi:hypothetical protein